MRGACWRRFLELDVHTQRDLARSIGTNAERVIGNLVDVDLTTHQF